MTGVRLLRENFQYFDALGAPLSGGKLFFYEAGTTISDENLKDTFADEALTVPNTNPIILDSEGRLADCSGFDKPVYVNQTDNYKENLLDQYNRTVKGYPKDNISASAEGGEIDLAGDDGIALPIATIFKTNGIPVTAFAQEGEDIGDGATDAFWAFKRGLTYSRKNRVPLIIPVPSGEFYRISGLLMPDGTTPNAGLSTVNADIYDGGNLRGFYIGTDSDVRFADNAWVKHFTQSGGGQWWGNKNFSTSIDPDAWDVDGPIIENPYLDMSGQDNTADTFNGDNAIGFAGGYQQAGLVNFGYARKVQIIGGKIKGARTLTKRVIGGPGGKAVNFEEGCEDGTVDGTEIIDCAYATFVSPTSTRIVSTMTDTGEIILSDTVLEPNRSVMRNIVFKNMLVRKCGTAFNFLSDTPINSADYLSPIFPTLPDDPNIVSVSWQGIVENTGHYPVVIYNSPTRHEKLAPFVVHGGSNLTINAVVNNDLNYPSVDNPGGGSLFPGTYPDNTGTITAGTDLAGGGLFGPIGAAVWGWGRNCTINIVYNGNADDVVVLARSPALYGARYGWSGNLYTYPADTPPITTDVNGAIIDPPIILANTTKAIAGVRPYSSFNFNVNVTANGTFRTAVKMGQSGRTGTVQSAANETYAGLLRTVITLPTTLDDGFLSIDRPGQLIGINMAFTGGTGGGTLISNGRQFSEIIFVDEPNRKVYLRDALTVIPDNTTTFALGSSSVPLDAQISGLIKVTNAKLTEAPVHRSARLYNNITAEIVSGEDVAAGNYGAPLEGTLADIYSRFNAYPATPGMETNAGKLRANRVIGYTFGGVPAITLENATVTSIDVRQYPYGIIDIFGTKADFQYSVGYNWLNAVDTTQLAGETSNFAVTTGVLTGASANSKFNVSVAKTGLLYLENCLGSQTEFSYTLRASPGTLDPATLTLVSAMTTVPIAARTAVIDTLVRALKTAGVWPLLDGLWMFAADSAQAALLDWLQTGSHNSATAVSSPTFTQDRGYTGNGSSSYIDTNKVLNVLGHFQQQQGFIAAGVRTTGTNAVIGTTSNDLYLKHYASNTMVTAVNSLTAFTTANTDTTGRFMAERTTFANVYNYRNNALLGSVGSVNCTAILAENLYALKTGSATFSTAQISYLAIGAALDTPKKAAFDAAVAAYLTSVGA